MARAAAAREAAAREAAAGGLTAEGSLAYSAAVARATAPLLASAGEAESQLSALQSKLRDLSRSQRSAQGGPVLEGLSAGGLASGGLATGALSTGGLSTGGIGDGARRESANGPGGSLIGAGSSLVTEQGKEWPDFKQPESWAAVAWKSAAADANGQGPV